MLYTVSIMTYFATLNFDFMYQLGLFGLIAAYAIVGVIIMVGCAMLCNVVFKFNLKKELLDDQNQALGTMLGGLFIAIAIIVAASIVG